jgi:peptidoglycan hydrolase-like protein with peptidoglycan-binding domain
VRFSKTLVASLVVSAALAFAGIARAEDVDTGDSFTPKAACQVPEGTTYQPTLQMGNYGMNVELLQSQLGIAADGCFGKQTDETVRRYQTCKGLVVDGVVGKQTWRALERDASISGCKATTTTTTATSSASGPKRIVIDQWKEVVRLKAGEETIDTMPMIDNPGALPKGNYTVCGFGRTVDGKSTRNGLSYNLKWSLPNFVRLCDASGHNTGQGFHAIPIDATTGVPMHDESFLGTGKKQSSGCIRLSRADSQILWDFAKKGMQVVVI